MPTGILAADYRCVDFEAGLPTSEWTQTLAKSGTASLTTSRAYSEPNSLSATVPAAADFATAGSAIFGWNRVGSNPITRVSISAYLSPATAAGVTPAWTGSVSLLCVAFGSGEACLAYTMGAEGLAFQSEPYTGYFIDWMYTGGPAIRSNCVVTGTLTANVWTQVELRVTKTSSSDTIAVLFGGATVGSCNGTFGADTVSTLAFGPEAHAETTRAYTVYYDNVVAYVAR